MGSPIAPDIRQLLEQDARVRRVTARHIVCKDGTVADPADFCVASHDAQFVLKLVACGCLCPITCHASGQHVIVPGYLEWYADGHWERRYTLTRCPRGQWIVEETEYQPASS